MSEKPQRYVVIKFAHPLVSWFGGGDLVAVPEGSMDSFEEAFDNATKVADAGAQGKPGPAEAAAPAEKGLAGWAISRR